MCRSLLGVLGLGLGRVKGRLTGPEPGRTLVCLVGVAFAIAILVVVTGLSLGLAASTTVQSEDVNYWVVPETEGTSTPLPYEGAQLGSVHEVSMTLSADEQIRHATPVAVQPLRLGRPETGDSEWVLALGVVPSTESYKIAGMQTGSLDDSYPYYANRTYNGTWTGELVVSPAVTELLGVDDGEQLTAGDSYKPLHVADVSDETPSVGIGSTPVVVMHLAELQTLTDTANGDQADQILVITETDVRDDLAGLYPRTTVVTRSGLGIVSVTPTNLPLAMAIGSGVVALGIGVAFVATMMGLELTASRQSLAILGALGVSRRTVAVMLVTETVTIALIGGLLGIALGALGIVGVNAALVDIIDLPAVATFDPLLIGYALAVAVIMGVISVLYPIYIAWRTDTLAELTR